MISPLENSPAVMNYVTRIGATIRTLFTAAIVVNSLGYNKDTYVIKFFRDGTVRAPSHLSPSEAEAAAIRAEILTLTFPAQQTLSALSNSNLPDLIKNAPSESLFIFMDKAKNIKFIQVRIELDNGDKRYVPQTYWSDGVWRMAEPEEGLPIYGMENVEKGCRVFLHEGAKAAKAAQSICKDPSHPWQQYFETGVHVGWIGGAHYVGKTLWRDLSTMAGELIIVPDNDFIGRSKISDIAKRFSCPTYFSQLDDNWPKSWDVADPIPDSFFGETRTDSSNDTHLAGAYIGPKFEDTVQSCDWATEQVGEMTNGNPIFGIREEFAQNWVRIQNLRHYAHLQKPEITLDKEQFNIKVRPYSDVTDTSGLLAKMSGNICDKVTFMPNQPTGLINLDGEMCLNQYVDRRVQPIAQGETGPFWEFMEYLFPITREREQITKWIATLYAKPNVRMGYALLLLSKMQGVGKSTILNILAELIGRRHVSFPGDAMIQGDFNGWVVNKRLVVVHEIYAGQNWKTYNRLKSLITDEFLEANNKHIVNYTLPNWAHFGAASNSMEALRMEHDDRRWFIPKLTEVLYDNYAGLQEWIRRGGLRYLAWDLANHGSWVKPGDIAPRTAAKAALIDQSMPTDERMVIALCERMAPSDCIDVKDIWLWLQVEARGKAYASPQRIASLLVENDYVVDQPTKIGSRMRQVVWLSSEARAKVMDGLSETDVPKKVSDRLKEPGQIFRNDATM